MLPTVAEVLTSAALSAGDPVVAAGRRGLHTPVRWAHVAPATGSARLLLGGELLLTTGGGWPGTEGELVRYIDEIADLRAAGLVLELGERYREAPAVVVERCDARGLPFIVLRRETRFVAVTEEIHSFIVDSQSALLQERAKIHGLFAGLDRRGAATTFVLDEAARLISRPVVLEDLSHRAVAWSLHDASPTDVLDQWGRRSRRATAESTPRDEPHEHTSSWPAEGWLVTSVRARGREWGRLVATGCATVPRSAEVVLENAARTLSLECLDGHAEWSDRAQDRLVSALLDRTYTNPASIRVQLEAMGFRTRGRHLVVAGRHGDAHDQDAVLDRLRASAAAENVDVVAAPISGRDNHLLVLASAERADHARDLLTRHLEGQDGNAATLVLRGPAGFDDLDEAVHVTVDLLDSAPSHARGSSAGHSPATELGLLVRSRSSEPAVRAYVENVLGPLLRWDADHDGDLIDVVRAFARHPSNRKRAAEESHLSRSVFYQRLDLIGRLLDLDLDDGRTITTLHVALLAHSQL
ncbi:PucR family transcriptional regulator [Aeromicrobium sp. CTD01-1L150]|uniref:PucR family transcriptional regulator n=1 Tax=Aeromicrobium sp. CTD01-1L150 TaxID=3341830 RepID=UPI0035C1A7D3